MTRARTTLAIGTAVLALAATVATGPARATVAPPICSPGGGPVELSGSVARDQARTYLYLPFEVADGTTRVEVGYGWNDTQPAPPSSPVTQSVFDLGLWDEDGVGVVDGFRGWSGSRQGKVEQGQAPVHVQADDAERGYHPGTVRPGIWHVELGVAAVAPNGADWRVVVTCSAPAVGAEPVPEPVDATHVASPEAGWYHGDFHLHGHHSSSTGPDGFEMAGLARAAGLDIVPVTEYVTTRHHDELGPVQAANPDLLILPGREIITYFGHANALGETPNEIDYRHGHADVTLRRIQEGTKADGALFQVNHPTIFPGPVFRNFCRGCEFELGDEIDWDDVDTIEVLTGPILVDQTDVGAPGPAPLQIEQPFVASAIDLWEEKLLDGHRITAVSGSDDKSGAGYGMNATAVFADSLSRADVFEALRRGRAYVRTRGVAASPAIEMSAEAPDGTTAMIGDSLAADRAIVTVRILGADGQLLRIVRDGDPVGTLPIVGDDASLTFPAVTTPGSGPLGTFWRVDVLDHRSLTVISNPIFLTGETDDAPAGGSDDDRDDRDGDDDDDRDEDDERDDGDD